jgi:hypothetical protein
MKTNRGEDKEKEEGEGDETVLQRHDSSQCQYPLQR